VECSAAVGELDGVEGHIAALAEAEHDDVAAGEAAMGTGRGFLAL
jgi:hypothetical protein